MNVKRLIIWIVSGVVTLSVLLVAITAAKVGSEASAVKDWADKAVAAHVPLDTAKTQLAGLGYEVAPSGTDLAAVGPHHTAVAYVTWLTVKLTFNPEGLANGYHIDRESTWF